MKYRLMNRWILPTIVMLMLASVCHACPTCKDAIVDGPQHAGMIRGYFWSILFMMSMPFLIFGSLSAYFYYQVRQARAAQAAETMITVSAASSPVTSA